MDSLMEILKPLGILAASLGSLAAAAWAIYNKVVMVNRQKDRDAGLHGDYEDIRKENREIRKENRDIQANMERIMLHNIRLEKSVQVLSTCCDRLASIVESMAAIIPTLIKEEANTPAFTQLLEELVRNAQEMRQQAVDATEEAKMEKEPTDEQKTS